MQQESPKTREVSFHEQLCNIDIVDPILDLWHQGKMSAGLDGKFRLHDELALNRLWIFGGFCPERDCTKWLNIYHMYYKILPPPCKNCWKVVMTPQTILELIEVQKLQAELSWPSKTGLENRDYTSGLGGYRAFWYCPFGKGLEGARVHFKRVRKALEKHLGEEKIAWYLEQGKLYLKRGCTELERDFGPSDQWDRIDHSAKFKLLESVWGVSAKPEDLTKDFSFLVYTNLKRWIEFAVAHGDSTVRQLIGGGALGVPAVKYHNSIHADLDFKPSIEPFNGSIEEEKDEASEVAEAEKGLFGFESAKG